MNNSDYENLLQQLRKDLVPIGSIFAFPAKKVPDGYLPCEGQELSIQLYPELYERIGRTWGGGKSSFRIPDLQGQFIRGWDREGDIDPEREFGKSQNDCFQGHSHIFNISNLKVSSSGSHDHDLYWGKFKMRDASLMDGNNHTQQIPIPYACKDESMYNREGTSYEMRDCTEVTGTHFHELTVDQDALIIGSPSNSDFGDVSERIGHETRPTNIALIFCIKVK